MLPLAVGEGSGGEVAGRGPGVSVAVSAAALTGGAVVLLTTESVCAFCAHHQPAPRITELTSMTLVKIKPKANLFFFVG